MRSGLRHGPTRLTPRDPFLKHAHSRLPFFPLVGSLPISLTCGTRTLSVPDPLGFRRLLLGSLRHRGGSYSYSGDAGRYFRFRQRGVPKGADSPLPALYFGVARARPVVISGACLRRRGGSASAWARNINKALPVVWES